MKKQAYFLIDLLQLKQLFHAQRKRKFLKLSFKFYQQKKNNGDINFKNENCYNALNNLCYEGNLKEI